MDQYRGLAWTTIVLGLVGLVIPFVGPLFNFGMGPEPAFAVTAARVIRHVIPGVAVVAGGALLLSGASSTRRFGGWLAVFGGAWLAVIPFLLQVTSAGQLARRLVYHSGTGLVITVLATYALGYLSGARTAGRTIDVTDRNEARAMTDVRG